MEPFPVKKYRIKYSIPKVDFQGGSNISQGRFFAGSGVYFTIFLLLQELQENAAQRKNPGQACESKAGIRKEWNFQKRNGAEEGT